MSRCRKTARVSRPIAATNCKVTRPITSGSSESCEAKIRPSPLVEHLGQAEFRCDEVPPPANSEKSSTNANPACSPSNRIEKDISSSIAWVDNADTDIGLFDERVASVNGAGIN